MVKTVVDATRRWMGAAALGVAIGMSSGAAQANERNLAPGFAQLPAGSKIVVMPVDVELFAISAGGVL